MEGPAPPPQAADRLRWLDLLPVIAFTVLGIVLVFAVLVGLARGSRGFYRANLETISLSAALAVYLASARGSSWRSGACALPWHFSGFAGRRRSTSA